MNGLEEWIDEKLSEAWTWDYSDPVEKFVMDDHPVPADAETVPAV